MHMALHCIRPVRWASNGCFWFWKYPYYVVCLLWLLQLIYGEHMGWRLQYYGKQPIKQNAFFAIIVICSHIGPHNSLPCMFNIIGCPHWHCGGVFPPNNHEIRSLGYVSFVLKGTNIEHTALPYDVDMCFKLWQIMGINVAPKNGWQPRLASPYSNTPLPFCFRLYSNHVTLGSSFMAMSCPDLGNVMHDAATPPIRMKHVWILCSIM
jgi:hypothetical protein